MATTEAPTEFRSLSTTREERGRQIARRGGIRQLGARYVVPSQSPNPSVPTYLVDVVEQTCTCPDFETRRQRCKHQEAVLFWLAWEGTVNVETGEITLPKKKQQSKQNWPAYNRSQTTERRRVPQFLHSLCLGVLTISPTWAQRCSGYFATSSARGSETGATSSARCRWPHSVLADVMAGRCEVSVVIAFRVAKVLDASIYDVIADRVLPGRALAVRGRGEVNPLAFSQCGDD